MPTKVYPEHIRQLQSLLLRMREYIQQGQSQKAEQLGYDHMALTGRGDIYSQIYDDAVELPNEQAHRLIHRHFRDLTYNFMAGHTNQTAADVIAIFDVQLARYAEFLTEHTPPVNLEMTAEEALETILEYMGLDISRPRTPQQAVDDIKKRWDEI